MNIKTRKCPVCGNKEVDILYRQKFAAMEGISFLNKYDVVCCQQCGFLYADGIPSQVEFNEYYTNASKYEKPRVVDHVHNQEKYDKTFLFSEQALERIGEKQENKSIVDVGCSTGDYLLYLKAKGYENLCGIDPSEQCVEYMKEQGINATCNTLDQISGEDKYDIVRFSEVMEHIVDLNNSVEKLKLLMKPSGVLYVSMPYVEGFVKTDNAPYQEFSVEHINYFTLNSLKNLMTRHGLHLLDYCVTVTKAYSDLEALFVLGETENVEASDGKAYMLEYISKCEKIEKKITNTIHELAKKNIPLIVWGVGTFTQHQLECGELGKCNIKLFVDGNEHYQGKIYRGIPIQSPKTIVTNETILIASFHAQKAIEKEIREERKLNNPIVKLFDV